LIRIVNTIDSVRAFTEKRERRRKYVCMKKGGEEREMEGKKSDVFVKRPNVCMLCKVSVAHMNKYLL
jgi:hypothetical protein